MKRWFAVLGVLLMLSGCGGKPEEDPVLVGALLPDVQEEMLDPDYWLKKDKKADEILMTEEEIAQYNESIAGKYDRVDLLALPELETGARVRGMLEGQRIPQDPYISGKPKPEGYDDALKANCNVESVQDQVTLRWGIVTQPTSVRLYPTWDRCMESGTDWSEDAFQVGKLRVGEGVAVYHTSGDGAWYYVQSTDYRGWMEAACLGLTSHSNWLDYLQAPHTLTVLAQGLPVQASPSHPELGDIVLGMGDRIPLYEMDDLGKTVDGRSPAGCYVMQFPTRTEVGSLTFTPVPVPVGQDVVEGYLPYTRENMVRQAFKLLGCRYGQNGLDGNWDQGLMFADLYRCFGLELPHQVKGLAQLPAQVQDTSSMEVSQKEKLLRETKAGTLVFSTEHAALYLGSVDKVPYFLHFVEETWEKNTAKPLYSCVISRADCGREGGGSYLSTMYRIAVLQLTEE